MRVQLPYELGEGGAFRLTVPVGGVTVPEDVSATNMVQDDEACEPDRMTVDGLQVTVVALFLRQLGGLVAPLEQVLHDG